MEVPPVPVAPPVPVPVPPVPVPVPPVLVPVPPVPVPVPPVPVPVPPVPVPVPPVPVPVLPPVLPPPTQAPLLQFLPPLQTVPQLPQLFESVAVVVQAVPHWVWPELQLELHWLLLQTWPEVQTFPQLPQLLASDVTHDEPHSIPEEQAHLPAWQLWPDWQTVPQAPQFWLSVCTFAQDPPHSSCPELQVVVTVAGLAQPATNRPEPRATTRAKREAVRASIFQTPYGDSELHQA